MSFKSILTQPKLFVFLKESASNCAQCWFIFTDNVYSNNIGTCGDWPSCAFLLGVTTLSPSFNKSVMKFSFQISSLKIFGPVYLSKRLCFFVEIFHKCWKGCWVPLTLVLNKRVARTHLDQKIVLWKMPKYSFPRKMPNMFRSLEPTCELMSIPDTCPRQEYCKDDGARLDSSINLQWKMKQYYWLYFWFFICFQISNMVITILLQEVDPNQSEMWHIWSSISACPGCVCEDVATLRL